MLNDHSQKDRNLVFKTNYNMIVFSQVLTTFSRVSFVIETKTICPKMEMPTRAHHICLVKDEIEHVSLQIGTIINTNYTVIS